MQLAAENGNDSHEFAAATLGAADSSRQIRGDFDTIEPKTMRIGAYQRRSMYRRGNGGPLQLVHCPGHSDWA